MTVQEVMEELRSKGNEGVKKILLRHGVKEPFFGVKIEDLKVIQKKIKKNYDLSKALYATGNADAMYLAGLIADEKKMTKSDLSEWINLASSTNIIEYTVPWITAESDFGYELALEWINTTSNTTIAVAGWSTLSSLVAIKNDKDLNIPELKGLLKIIETTIHHSDDRVKLKMNGFVIAIGCYVIPLTEEAIATAKSIGILNIIIAGTACKVPNAQDYIKKVIDKGIAGKKKKMARC